MNEIKSKQIIAAYERICAAHDQIAAFRAKLLALLPIASGAGILFLMSENIPKHEFLIQVGIFGELVTIGLYFYELRGIQKCRGLIACASKLEKQLIPDFWHYAAFNFRQPGALGGFVGAVGAAIIIYPTVIRCWIFVSISGFTHSQSTGAYETGFVVCLWLVGFIFGLLPNRWQKKTLIKQLSKVEKQERETGK